MTTCLERVRRIVEEDFRDGDRAHDLGHLDRVSQLAAELAEQEGGDTEAAAIAGYVHDYHRLLERRTGVPARPEEAEPDIRRALTRAEVPDSSRRLVLTAVAATDSFTFSGHSVDVCDTTAACVRDADILDAMGAIGIARAFLYGGMLGEPMWVPDSALRTRYREGRTSSVVAHFYEKLVRLHRDVVTDTGRRIADDRHHFLMEFLTRFHDEYGDSDVAPLRDLPGGPC
ncbi:HD domain-containing protein [Saccharomonospora iraqiensis]|uniref:HD domain-containing protein n=1 Tax=Saccharomonospora iraqiensis TaxID=52698 RepID=UPI00022E4CC9|nr:HD domain-containing protein [Saccharomonospora iraqiensis]